MKFIAHTLTRTRGIKQQNENSPRIYICEIHIVNENKTRNTDKI